MATIFDKPNETSFFKHVNINVGLRYIKTMQLQRKSIYFCYSSVKCNSDYRSLAFASY